MWGFFNFYRNPWDLLAYSIFTMVCYALFGISWWLPIVLIFGFFFWPYAFSWVRTTQKRVTVEARVSGIAREPGAHYCPECGERLEQGQDYFATNERCAQCGGMWCAAQTLQDAVSKKTGRPPLEWKEFPEQAQSKENPCPVCFAPMRTGGFAKVTAPVYCCAKCAGFWSSRLAWLSYELSL